MFGVIVWIFGTLPESDLLVIKLLILMVVSLVFISVLTFLGHYWKSAKRRAEERHWLVCPYCQYDLIKSNLHLDSIQVTSVTCPECGCGVTHQQLLRHWRVTKPQSSARM